MDLVLLVGVTSVFDWDTVQQPILFMVLLWQRKGMVAGNTHIVSTTCPPLKGQGVVLQIRAYSGTQRSATTVNSDPLLQQQHTLPSEITID